LGREYSPIDKKAKMKRMVIWLQAFLVLALTLTLGVGVEGQGREMDSVVHIVQPGDTLAAIALRYGASLEAIAQENGIQDRNLIQVGQELAIPDPAQNLQGVLARMSASPALEWLPDNDPGPPFSVEIVTNRAIPHPLLPASQTYQVAGIVRNDGTETYAISRINVTFIDEEGFRGYVARRSNLGERHGETEAEFACLLLAPGETCPFVAEITAQDMAAFLVHPDAGPTGRESAPVELSQVTLSYEGPNIVRISALASNPNPFEVKNVVVAGVLLDARGQIVQTGAAYVLQDGIGTGESVRFDVRIRHEEFVTYRLYAQAERDWK
jgi:LysM repeat protein